jgi:hypothetical protein
VFVQATENGEVYRLAGGAPIYVSSWVPFGGGQPVTVVPFARVQSLLSVPADGTFIQGQQRGEVYRVAGGAPIYVSSWAPFGGEQPFTVVDQVAIDGAGSGTAPFSHLRAVPADGTFIQGAQTGRVYQVEGGKPVYVPSWAPFGGEQPFTVVDQAAIDAAGTGGKWDHLL